MKKLRLVMILLLSTVTAASAADSFRLSNGSLIATGKSKADLIALAGDPMYHDVETFAVDTGAGIRRPVKREILTYRLNGSIGGMYLVVVTVENSTIVSVTAKQEGRL
jgi:hypothetical protein